MESMPRRMMGTASLVPKAQRRKMAKVRHYRWAQRLPISKARKNVWHLGSLWTMPALPRLVSVAAAPARSTSVTARPLACRCNAAETPTIPAPSTTTSVRCKATRGSPDFGPEAGGASGSRYLLCLPIDPTRLFQFSTTAPSWPGLSRPSTRFNFREARRQAAAVRRGCPAQGRA